VDESARAKKRQFSGDVKGPVAAGTRSGKEKENVRRSNLRRSTTGVKDNEKGKSLVVGSRSLPVMGEGRGDDEMAVEDGTAFEMDLDVEMNVGPSERRLDLPSAASEIASTSTSDPYTRHNIPNSRLHMPPPPVPVPKTRPPRLSRNMVVASQPTSNSVSIPKPKLVSLQPAPPNPQLQASPAHPPHLSQQPSRPPSSQLSSRPPALGMRRSLTAFSSLTPSQTLPDKQRGFKVPLARPPPTSTPISVVPVPVSSHRQTNLKPAQVLPTPEPSPPIAAKGTRDRDQEQTGTPRDSSSPVPDADSSYGDISFDMEALEETMRKYD